MSGTLIGALDVAQFAQLLTASRAAAAHGYVGRNDTAKAHAVFQARDKEQAVLSAGYTLLSFRDITLSAKAFEPDFASHASAAIEIRTALIAMHATVKAQTEALNCFLLLFAQLFDAFCNWWDGYEWISTLDLADHLLTQLQAIQPPPPPQPQIVPPPQPQIIPPPKKQTTPTLTVHGSRPSTSLAAPPPSKANARRNSTPAPRQPTQQSPSPLGSTTLAPSSPQPPPVKGRVRSLSTGYNQRVQEEREKENLLPTLDGKAQNPNMHKEDQKAYCEAESSQKVSEESLRRIFDSILAVKFDPENKEEGPYSLEKGICTFCNTSQINYDNEIAQRMFVDAILHSKKNLAVDIIKLLMDQEDAVSFELWLEIFEVLTVRMKKGAREFDPDAVKNALIYCIKDRQQDCNHLTIVKTIALYLVHTKSCQEDGATALLTSALKSQQAIIQNTICEWIAAFKCRADENPSLLTVKSNAEALCLQHYKDNGFKLEDEDLTRYIELKWELIQNLAQGK